MILFVFFLCSMSGKLSDILKLPLKNEARKNRANMGCLDGCSGVWDVGFWGWGWFWLALSINYAHKGKTLEEERGNGGFLAGAFQAPTTFTANTRSSPMALVYFAILQTNWRPADLCRPTMENPFFFLDMLPPLMLPLPLVPFSIRILGVSGRPFRIACLVIDFRFHFSCGMRRATGRTSRATTNNCTPATPLTYAAKVFLILYLTSRMNAPKTTGQEQT